MSTVSQCSRFILAKNLLSLFKPILQSYMYKFNLALVMNIASEAMFCAYFY